MAEKKPKPTYVKCEGGPWATRELRVEAGHEPPERVPFPNAGGVYVHGGGLYKWYAQ